MKPPVAITLILAGVLLILAPAISDYMQQRSLIELLVEREFTSANLDGKMQGIYRQFCCVAGLVMIATGVGCSLRRSGPGSD